MWSCNPRRSAGWVRAILCIPKSCIVSNALHIFDMYGTCYNRDVVPCGLGHRLIVSRGRGNIYELNDGNDDWWILSYSRYWHTAHAEVRGRYPSCTNLSLFLFFLTKIMHTQVRERHPSCTQCILTKPCILRWGEIPQLHPLYTL